MHSFNKGLFSVTTACETDTISWCLLWLFLIRSLSLVLFLWTRWWKQTMGSSRLINKSLNCLCFFNANPKSERFCRSSQDFRIERKPFSCDLDRLRSGIGIWYTVGESNTIYNNFNTNNRPWRILLVILLDWQSFKLGNLSFEQSKFHEKCKSLFLYNSFTRRKKFSKLKDIIKGEVFHLRKVRYLVRWVEFNWNAHLIGLYCSFRPH